MSWRAYVDESEPAQRSGAGVYLLAAMVIEDQNEAAAREMALGLRLKGQRKLHWHDENTERRELLIDAVAGLSALHLITVRTDQHAPSERRRRLCLNRPGSGGDPRYGIATGVWSVRLSA